ncbi:MAG: hypothetical protein ACK4FB_08130 [Brevundimonas sp.]|uniref:hypothetical protein n=1 Tax=Brevundimonas sp. TaxID=1871086 RepID=UPI00391CEC50
MPNRRQARRLYEEALNRYGREIAEAFRLAVQDLKEGADLQRVIAAIEQGNIEAAVEAMNLDRAAFANLEAKIREAYATGGALTAQTVPASVGIGFRFNPGDPGAERWLREHSSRLITGLVEEQREAVRAVLVQGRIDGVGPRAQITELVGRVSRATGQRTGGILGLSGPQTDYLASARAELASADPAGLRNYLTRARRDRRYDRAVHKALRDGTTVPADTARMAAEGYRSRMLAYRAEVIGKHEGHAAVRASKQEAYDQLVATGRVAESDLEKVWLRTAAKNPRDSHVAMAGKTVGLKEAFTSPTGARMMYPGDSSMGAGASDLVGCLCDFVIRIKREPSQ